MSATLNFDPHDKNNHFSANMIGTTCELAINAKLLHFDYSLQKLLYKEAKTVQFNASLNTHYAGTSESPCIWISSLDHSHFP